MEGLLLVARLVLAALFAVAGAAKLFDVAGTRRGISDFGIPAALARPFALTLPLVELAIAAMLIPRSSAPLAAAAGFLLLAGMLTVILVNLSQGRRPDCRCFGQLRAAPIGVSTVALNASLLAVAALLVGYGPGASVFPAIAALSPFEGIVVGVGTAALAGIIALIVLAQELLQRQAAIAARLDKLKQPGSQAQVTAGGGLPVGAKAPAFALEALAGGTVTLDHLLAAGKPVLLVFTDPDCHACKTMLPNLARWQRDHPLTVAVVSSGTAEENQAFGAHGLRHVLLQRKYEVADAYDCEGAPDAVIVRPDGSIGSPVAGGADAIAQLVASITAPPADAPRIASTLFLRSRGS